jgi:hypothetical protein
MTTDEPVFDAGAMLEQIRGHVRVIRDEATSRAARATHGEWLADRVEQLDTWLTQRVHDVALPRDWAHERPDPGLVDYLRQRRRKVHRDDATHPRELPEPDPFVDLVRRVLEALDAEGYYVPLPLPPFVDVGSVAAFLGLVRRPQGADDDDQHATVATLESAITAGELLRRKLNGGL